MQLVIGRHMIGNCLRHNKVCRPTAIGAIRLRSDCVVGKNRSVYNAITSPARGGLLSLTAGFSHTMAHTNRRRLRLALIQRDLARTAFGHSGIHDGLRIDRRFS